MHTIKAPAAFQPPSQTRCSRVLILKEVGFETPWHVEGTHRQFYLSSSQAVFITLKNAAWIYRSWITCVPIINSIVMNKNGVYTISNQISCILFVRRYLDRETKRAFLFKRQHLSILNIICLKCINTQYSYTKFSTASWFLLNFHVICQHFYSNTVHRQCDNGRSHKY